MKVISTIKNFIKVKCYEIIPIANLNNANSYTDINAHNYLCMYVIIMSNVSQF